MNRSIVNIRSCMNHSKLYSKQEGFVRTQLVLRGNANIFARECKSFAREREVSRGNAKHFKNPPQIFPTTMSLKGHGTFINSFVRFFCFPRGFFLFSFGVTSCGEGVKFMLKYNYIAEKKFKYKQMYRSYPLTVTPHF